MAETIPEDYDGLRWTSELIDCSFPVALDTYSKCSFGCLYCFAAFVKEQRLGLGPGACSMYEKPVRSISVRRMRDIFSGKRKTTFSTWLSEKRPIQWGALADQFDLWEKRYGKTLELMRYLSEIDYPVSFSTKSAWVFSDERYLELFRKQGRNWHVKVSIVTLDADKARLVERGVPSPMDRLNAMRAIAKCGCPVTLRLRPFIIGLSDVRLEELIARAADAGAYSVSTEALCIDARNALHDGTIAKRNFAELSGVVGFDLVEYYRKYSERKSGLMRLSAKEKEPILERVHRLCDLHGLKFFCSDACGKANSESCCCCGAPPWFRYSTGNFSQALQIVRKSGSVRWSDISGDMAHLDVPLRDGQFRCTASTLTRHRLDRFTLRDYLHYCWNNLKSLLSPAKIFSDYVEAAGLDENGDVIYRRKQ